MAETLMRKKALAACSLVTVWLWGGASDLRAQDLVLTNVRIVVGNGSVIDQGSIVIRGGLITAASPAASPAAANAAGLPAIDAKGLTAMPGFIDAHRHVNTGPNEREQMQQLL